MFVFIYMRAHKTFVDINVHGCVYRACIHCTCMDKYINQCIRACIHTYIQTFVHACIHNICMYTYMYISAYAYTSKSSKCIHTYRYTNIYTYMLAYNHTFTLHSITMKPIIPMALRKRDVTLFILEYGMSHS